MNEYCFIEVNLLLEIFKYVIHVDVDLYVNLACHLVHKRKLASGVCFSGLSFPQFKPIKMLGVTLAEYKKIHSPAV